MTEGSADVMNQPGQIAGVGSRWTALYAGDTTLVLQFGETIERSIVDQVTALDSRIHSAMRNGLLKGVLETVPTFRSLAVVYDPLIMPPCELLPILDSLDVTQESTSGEQGSAQGHWQLPVLYGTDHGPDLQNVSELTGLDSEDVIDLHSSCTYTVYMLGFLPGYAFLGDTPEALYLPRRSEPRLRVPPGSVSIAMQLTGIYPWDSPGGWHIIGNCPVPMFNAQHSPPALLKAGDKVSFTRIDQQQFDLLNKELSGQTPDRSRWSISTQ